MKNYFKYLFSNKENWPAITFVSLLLIGALIQTKDSTALIFTIPLLVLIGRSIKMYKEKK